MNSIMRLALLRIALRLPQLMVAVKNAAISISGLLVYRCGIDTGSSSIKADTLNWSYFSSRNDLSSLKDKPANFFKGMSSGVYDI